MDLPRISQIEIFPIRPKNGLIGFASFTIDGAFAVAGVGIHTRPNGEGIRLVYPVKTLSNGAEITLFHPICRGVGEAVDQAVGQQLHYLNSINTRRDNAGAVNSGVLNKPFEGGQYESELCKKYTR